MLLPKQYPKSEDHRLQMYRYSYYRSAQFARCISQGDTKIFGTLISPLVALEYPKELREPLITNYVHRCLPSAAEHIVLGFISDLRVFATSKIARTDLFHESNAHLDWILRDPACRSKLSKDTSLQYVETRTITRYISMRHMNLHNAKPLLDAIASRDLNGTHLLHLKPEMIGYIASITTSSVTGNAIANGGHLRYLDISKFSSVVRYIALLKVVQNDNILKLISSIGYPQNGPYGRYQNRCLKWSTYYQIFCQSGAFEPTRYIVEEIAYTPNGLQGDGWELFFASVAYHATYSNFGMIQSAIDYLSSLPYAHKVTHITEILMKYLPVEQK